MSDRNQPAENPTGIMDDFQRIKGIGPSIASALHASGVHRFSDLAHYNAEDLVNLLSPKVGFMTIQRIERDDWLGQARALSSDQAQTAKTSAVEQQPLLLASEQSSPSKVNSHPKERAASWIEIADFFVSYGQAIDSEGRMRLFTRVHHSQADRFEQWDDVATSQLIEWMLTQANLSAEASEPVSTRPEDEGLHQPQAFPQPEEEAQVEISDLWVSQVETPAMVNGVAQDGLLRLESKITLTGPDALHLTHERIPYNVQVYLVETETNQSTCASIFSGQLAPEELSYMVEQDFPTPRRGRYQVNVIGQLNLPGSSGSLRTLFGYLQGPVLRVGV